MSEKARVSSDERDTCAAPRLLPKGLPDVRESDDAGQYYCAHALFLGHLAVERGLAPLARDDAGDPLVGFLHVPPDAQTRGDGCVSDEERHRDTARVVAAALAGWWPSLARLPADEPLRVALTGYGTFRDVVDNPTGAYVRSPPALEATLQLAFDDALMRLSFEADGALSADVLVDGCVRSLTMAREALPVDDRVLALGGEGSLLGLLEERARVHAWLGLGVCRSPHYRVETAPHDGGLVFGDEGGRHEDGREPTRRLVGSRALVRALERGGVVVASRLGRV